MQLVLSENDWRHFRTIHKTLLERHCQETLDQLQPIIESMEGDSYMRYHKVYDLFKKRDRELDDAFNDFRHATAVLRLSIMRRIGLLTDEDLQGFSEVTRTLIGEAGPITDV